MAGNRPLVASTSKATEALPTGNALIGGLNSSETFELKANDVETTRILLDPTSQQAIFTDALVAFQGIIPDVELDAGAGSGATLDEVTGNLVTGKITFTTGSSLSITRAIVRINFPFTLSHAPIVQITPANGPMAAAVYEAKCWTFPLEDVNFWEFRYDELSGNPLEENKQYAINYFMAVILDP